MPANPKMKKTWASQLDAVSEEPFRTTPGRAAQSDLIHKLDAVLAAVLHGQLAVHRLEWGAQLVLVDEVRLCRMAH